MTGTLVFIPAWNEEQNIGAVIRGLRDELPEADVLVVDDGSTDQTAAVARVHGAEVLSLDGNQGLSIGIASGYRWALDHDYAYCGRVDADGQHPAAELARLLARVYAGECDVAVGSRFVSGEGYEPYRYRPSGTPATWHSAASSRNGSRPPTAVCRRHQRPLCGQCESAAATGRTIQTEAPEVEALLRLDDAALRVEEVPVEMKARASGDSKLRGRKALRVTTTVIGTLLAARFVWARRSR